MKEHQDTSAAGNGNGTNRVLWWMIGSVCAPLVLALTGTMLNLGITSAQRISALESRFDDIRRNLEALDRKLDRVIDATKRGQP